MTLHVRSALWTLQDLSFFDHPPLSIYISYGIKVYKKFIFLTTYPPPLVNVVCEPAPKMVKTDSFLGNQKLSLNQNVWRDHATMQQDVLLHFGVMFLY